MQHQTQNRIATTESQPFVTVEANLAQIERLGELGALTSEQLEAGRKAGKMQVNLPAHLVKEFERGKEATEALPVAPLDALAGLETADPAAEKAELERLAHQINEAGMNTMARLFIATNRPLSFFASQFLLMLQPVSRLTLGAKDPTGRYSRLLEKRANLDYLLTRLDELEAENRRQKAARRLAKKERK